MKSISINIEDLFALQGAVIYSPDSFRRAASVSTDTRTIKKGSIFFALKGNKFDGHAFVRQAAEKGAGAVIIHSSRLKDFDDIDCTIVTVKNTTVAYGELARTWLKKLGCKVIAISGSNGKTTTKEILSSLLSGKYTVAKTLSNNNNNIGVPLTIFSTRPGTEYLVLEIGTNHFGEVAYSAKIASPDFSLITNIGASHLEFLRDLEGVAEEKCALFDITNELGGKIFINADDPILIKRKKKYKDVVVFGSKSPADIKGKVISVDSEGKPTIEIDFKGEKEEIALPLAGLANAKNFLSASALAFHAGMTPSQISAAAEKIVPVDKRLNILNLNGVVLINDTYNANPESMKAAFEFISAYKNNKNKIAVLGDMFELGQAAGEEHGKLKDLIKKNKINKVYLTGKLMRNLAEKLAPEKTEVHYFSSRKALAKRLIEEDFEGAVVLVKGSRGMKMEEFVNILQEKYR